MVSVGPQLSLLRRVDANRDGRISTDEMRVLGTGSRPVTDGQLKEVMSIVDADRDQHLSKRDLVLLAPSHQQLDMLWRLMGTKRNGNITLLEYEAFLKKNSTLGPEDRASIFAYLDQNGDGVLTRDDLVHPEWKATDMDHTGPEGARTLLNRADKNRDGKITKQEWKRSIRPGLRQGGPIGIRKPNRAIRRNLFRTIDTNLDNVLTDSELRSFALLTKEQTAMLVRYFGDLNNDHKISKAEFTRATPGMPDGMEELRLPLFEMMDTDGDGFVTKKEIMSVVVRLHDIQTIKPPERLWRLMDTDDDRKITSSEVTKFVEWASLLMGIPKGGEHMLFTALDEDGDGVVTRNELPSSPEELQRRLVKGMVRANSAPSPTETKSRAGREDQNLSYTFCLHPPPSGPSSARATRDANSSARYYACTPTKRLGT